MPIVVRTGFQIGIVGQPRLGVVLEQTGDVAALPGELVHSITLPWENDSAAGEFGMGGIKGFRPVVKGG